MISKKILIIEDENDIGESLRELLSLEGYDAWYVANGEEGLTFIKRHQPDLILCDIMMRDMDGFDVLEEFMKMPVRHKTPFVFVTALADNENIERSRSEGADDYLIKPFTRQELLDTIDRNLNPQSLKTISIPDPIKNNL
jgi:CheY-like chemotaxis protein